VSEKKNWRYRKGDFEVNTSNSTEKVLNSSKLWSYVWVIYQEVITLRKETAELFEAFVTTCRKTLG
jgi:hypothetical protein